MSFAVSDLAVSDIDPPPPGPPPPPPPPPGVPPSTPKGPQAFADAVLDLFPGGVAWPRDPTATLDELAAGIGDAMWRIDERADDLTETEANPAKTVELLPQWEAAWGLPDPCSALGAFTLQQRHAALLAKLAAQGGQSADYYIAVAAAMGVPITITTFQPAVAGRLRAGQPLYGKGFAFVWQVNVAATVVIYFRAGASAAGEPLEAGGNAELECRLRAIAPAHTVLVFSYGG